MRSISTGKSNCWADRGADRSGSTPWPISICGCPRRSTQSCAGSSRLRSTTSCIIGWTFRRGRPPGAIEGKLDGKLGGGKFERIFAATIDGKEETVAWAWERPDGGRSFGYVGMHFHENWKLVEYRRLAAQAALWSLKMDVPKDGLKVDVDEADLKLPEAAK
jgi:hypothetical protein